jgi:hypothetical protein
MGVIYLPHVRSEKDTRQMKLSHGKILLWREIFLIKKLMDIEIGDQQPKIETNQGNLIPVDSQDEEAISLDRI